MKKKSTKYKNINSNNLIYIKYNNDDDDDDDNNNNNK